MKTDPSPLPVPSARPKDDLGPPLIARGVRCAMNHGRWYLAARKSKFIGHDPQLHPQFRRIRWIDAWSIRPLVGGRTILFSGFCRLTIGWRSNVVFCRLEQGLQLFGSRLNVCCLSLLPLLMISLRCSKKHAIASSVATVRRP